MVIIKASGWIDLGDPQHLHQAFSRKLANKTSPSRTSRWTGLIFLASPTINTLHSSLLHDEFRLVDRSLRGDYSGEGNRSKDGDYQPQEWP